MVGSNRLRKRVKEDEREFEKRLTGKQFTWEEKLSRSEFETTTFVNDEKKTAKRSSLKKTMSIDSIKLTQRFLNVCRSVDYIANIMKAKAQLDEVNSLLNIVYLSIFLKQNVFSIHLLR